MVFSQRIGITPNEKLVQLRTMDSDLRNTLWSLLTVFYWEKFDGTKYLDFGGRGDQISHSNLQGIFISLWVNYFKEPVDTIPDYFYDRNGGLLSIRDYFLNQSGMRSMT